MFTTSVCISKAGQICGRKTDQLTVSIGAALGKSECQLKIAVTQVAVGLENKIPSSSLRLDGGSREVPFTGR